MNTLNPRNIAVGVLIPIIFILLSFYACEKEPVGKGNSIEKGNYIIVMDTLIGSYHWGNYNNPYYLDLNGDNIIDLSFTLGESVGGHYYAAYSAVSGKNNSRIVYFTKNYTTWIYNNTDTTFMHYTFKQVEVYKLNDTIDSNALYTNEPIFIAKIDDDLRTSTAPEHTYIDIWELKGKTFYLGVALETGYAWVKIKVLNYSRIVILRYAYSKSSEGLVIKE